MTKAKPKAPAKKARKRKTPAADSTPTPDSTPAPDSAEQQVMIAEAAYFIAEHRGFVGGDEISDWLQAERKIQSSLRQ